MNKYQIAKKEPLTPEITQITVYAPLVAAKAKAEAEAKAAAEKKEA